MTPQQLITRLELAPHPEGGHFRETYRSAGTIPRDALPDRFGGARSFSTAIVFMLRGGETSALHRIAADEMWHAYGGTTVMEVVELSPHGRMRLTPLGTDAVAGQHVQHVVPAGHWFGARLATDDPAAYALVGCTVAPGFDFADFELAGRDELLRAFPQHADLVRAMTRS